MSQSEVLYALKKNKKPMSGCEIAKEINDDDKHVYHSLKRLIKSRSIKVMEIDRFQAMKLYRCKRRMYLYYV